jgi:hypothetical protein
LEPDQQAWSTSRLSEASSLLIELAHDGLLPEEHETEVRSIGYDLLRIAELLRPES